MEEKATIDWKTVALFSVVFLGFLASFAGGVVLQKMFSTEGNKVVVLPLAPVVTPIPTLTVLPEGDVAEVQPGTGLLKDKAYFDDSVMLVSTEMPRRVLVATVTRNDKGDTWAQNGRVSFFDGEKWTRKIVAGTAESADIVTSSLIKSWKIDFDPSRVLKQIVRGEVVIDGKNITFDTRQLANEIGMRSLPGYTKFMSYGNGSFVLSGKTIAAKVLYTRIYSMNSSEIQFYSGKLGLTTDWIAFWDNDGNFYHIDKTSVDKPTEIYKTHEIGVMEGVDGTVLKTFSVAVNRDTQMPPEKYEISMVNPIGTKLSLVRGIFIDKAPNSDYKWFMGLIDGTVKTEKGEKTGFGVVEFIHD